MDDMLRSIIRDDPDQALKQAMASKQGPRVNIGPKLNIVQEPNPNCDNMSESNFSSQTSIPADAQSQQNEQIFKLPIVPDVHSKMEKQLQREFASCVKQLKKIPVATAEHYYNYFLKRIKIFSLRVTADLLEQSTSRFMAPDASLMSTMMMDCNASVSHYSGGRDGGFQGSTMFANQGHPTFLNESVRSHMFNGTRNPVASSTTETPPENQSTGTFLAASSKSQTGRSQQMPSMPNQEINNTRNLDQTTTQTDTTKTGGGFIFARPAADPCAPRKQAETVRKSVEKKPSPAGKSTSLNASVKNSPLSRTMNATANSTLNRTSSQPKRRSISEEVVLKNWTLVMRKLPKCKEATLHLKGTIYERNGSGSSGQVHESAAVEARLSESSVRTKDKKTYHLYGRFQNTENLVPKHICSSFINQKGGFPSRWRSMQTVWGTKLKGRAKDTTVSDGSGLESPTTSGTKRQYNRRSSFDSPIPVVKAKPKGYRFNDSMAAGRRKKISPSKSRRDSPMNSTLIKAAARDKEREIKALEKQRELKAREKELKKAEALFKAKEKETEMRKAREKEQEKLKAQEKESLRLKQKETEKKPVAKPIVKPVSKPVVRSTSKGRKNYDTSYESACSSVDVAPAKKPRQAPVRYWNDADISLTESERSKATFVDSDSSFKIVSPGKTLHNIKKLKDSNIINSQVTPPTAYFTSVMTNSDKKSEKTLVEKTKKPLKRLADRVLKKGRPSQDVSSQIKNKLSSKDPKEIKKFIQESEVQFKKVAVSKSRLDDEMSEISDLLSDDNDENEETI